MTRDLRVCKGMRKEQRSDLSLPTPITCDMYCILYCITHQGLKEFFLSDFREKFLIARGVQIRWNFCNIFITY